MSKIKTLIISKTLKSYENLKQAITSKGCETSIIKFDDMIEHLRVNKYQVIVVELSFYKSSRVTGIQIAKMLTLSESPKIFGISDFYNPNFEPMLRIIGANGYLLENMSLFDLLMAIHSSIEGDGSYIPVPEKYTLVKKWSNN